MERDRLMRRALGFSAIYNFAAALLFAFPSSWPGRVAGLPPMAPLIYRMLLGFSSLCSAPRTPGFGASQPSIGRWSGLPQSARPGHLESSWRYGYWGRARATEYLQLAVI